MTPNQEVFYGGKESRLPPATCYAAASSITSHPIPKTYPYNSKQHKGGKWNQESTGKLLPRNTSPQNSKYQNQRNRSGDAANQCNPNARVLNIIGKPIETVKTNCTEGRQNQSNRE
jgi:hypothetical protein